MEDTSRVLERERLLSDVKFGQTGSKNARGSATGYNLHFSVYWEVKEWVRFGSLRWTILRCDEKTQFQVTHLVCGTSESCRSTK